VQNIYNFMHVCPFYGIICKGLQKLYLRGMRYLFVETCVGNGKSKLGKIIEKDSNASDFQLPACKGTCVYIMSSCWSGFTAIMIFI